MAQVGLASAEGDSLMRHRRVLGLALSAAWARGVLVRRLALAGLFGLGLGCASSATQTADARLAWEARDLERGRECAQAGGRWIAGECNFRCD
jgi:hypothetical protein